MTFEQAMAAVANALGLTWVPENAEERSYEGSLHGASRRPMHSSRRTPSEAPR